jgi:hypothetical protein
VCRVENRDGRRHGAEMALRMGEGAFGECSWRRLRYGREPRGAVKREVGGLSPMKWLVKSTEEDALTVKQDEW